jgi:Na+/pantothenate symporter
MEELALSGLPDNLLVQYLATTFAKQLDDPDSVIEIVPEPPSVEELKLLLLIAQEVTQLTAILLLALWTPMNWLFWVPAIGTLAQVLFGYCLLARCLSLLSRNRRAALSWHLVCAPTHRHR